MTLRELREVAGLTQRQVADKLGVTVQAICNYESGARSIHLEQVLKMAELYDISAEDVIHAQLESIVVRKPDKVI